MRGHARDVKYMVAFMSNILSCSCIIIELLPQEKSVTLVAKYNKYFCYHAGLGYSKCITNCNGTLRLRYHIMWHFSSSQNQGYGRFSADTTGISSISMCKYAIEFKTDRDGNILIDLLYNVVVYPIIAYAKIMKPRRVKLLIESL